MAELREMMIISVLFSAVLIGLSTFYVDLTSPSNLGYYGLSPTQIANISPQDLSYMNVSNEIANRSEKIKEALEARALDPSNPFSVVDSVWLYTSAAINAITLPLSSTWIMLNMVANVGTVLGIPAWVGTIIIAVIILIIIFTIASAYLKWPI